MEPDWTSDCGTVKLWNRDCRDVLPTLSGIDSCITDPPYGIGYVSHHENSIDYGRIAGDERPFEPSHLLAYPFVILWGANNYATHLPIGGWITWDKRLSEAADKILGSPFELAWCSRRTTFRIIRALHGGAKNADAPNGDVHNQPRFHPTQKPVVVMQRCVELSSGTVCDPYMGSGSTGIACVRLGRHFYGVELDPSYFATAVKRIKAELNRMPLFTEPPLIQQPLIGDEA